MSAPMDKNMTQDQVTESCNETKTDRFKQSFKFFKRRKPPPDFSSVIDFQCCESNNQVHQVSLQDSKVKASIICKSYGLKPVEDWKAFSLHDVPGFVFLQNPFLPGYQRYWIKRSLRDFPQKPNVCNLDAHVKLKDDDCMWDMSQSGVRNPKEGKSLIEQLRWVTFGYHHNWDTKLYEEDHHSPFPEDLAGMTQLIAGVFGYHKYQAEAAIVNFYHLDSTLGGHTDHSEFDMEMPIISYSFGQSAIFLVGGQTKEQTPNAMYLQSGDIIMMGGPSRLAYHAVPRILPSTDGNIPQCLQSKPELTSHGNEPANEQHAVNVSQSPGEEADCIIEGKGTEGCGVLKEGVKDSQSLEILDTRTSVSSSKKRSNDSGIDKSDPARTLSSSKVLCTEHSNFATKTVGGSVESQSLSIKTAESAINDFEAQLRDLCCGDNWNAFGEYLKCSRINVSVRQVKRHGQGFPGKSLE